MIEYNPGGAGEKSLSTITTIKDAVAKYRVLTESIESLEATIADVRDARERLLCSILPDIMHQSGQSSTTLDDGAQVALETVWAVDVPKVDGINDYTALATWLKSQGYGAIIQDSLTFSKGSDVSRITAELDASGIVYKSASSVHWMSLRKTIKEHMEQGGDVPPEDAATVRVFERAKIKGIGAKGGDL